MYVPYGESIKDTNGNVQPQGIDQNYCETQLKDPSIGTLTICDAPGGMARIFNAGTIKSGYVNLIVAIAQTRLADHTVRAATKIS